jgi:hypothetical protein
VSPVPLSAQMMASAIRLTVILVAAAELLTCAELLAIRSQFRVGGLADAALTSPPGHFVLVRRVSVGWIPVLATAETVLALALLGLVFAGLDLLPAILAITIAVILRNQLSPAGRDASDDMSVIVTASLAIALVGRRDPSVTELAFGFITAQLCLCYATSGITKLAGPRWRSGQALPAIMRTASYGSPSAAALLDRVPFLALALSWLVIACEISFPVLMVLGGSAGVCALACGALFQLSVAALMGLNRFVPWFLAGYPAAFWTVQHHGLLR